MALEEFKRLRKGSLLGFATVRLPIGLRIADIPVCTSHGKVWASLPSKPMIGADGRQLEKDSKKRYQPILQWADRETADRWSAAVVELVREHDPEALE
jgi:hypothetical protein